MPQEHSPDPKKTTSRFEKLLADLVRDEVDFAVVGGVAVILNGYPRLTVDVDILVNSDRENIRKLLDCLCRWGEGWARELRVEDFAPQEGSIRVTEEFDLDIFTRMKGRSLADFRSGLRLLKTETAQIPYLSPSDLIFLKEDSWREKDRLDVQAMKEVLAREIK